MASKNMMDNPEFGVYLYKGAQSKWINRKKDREMIEANPGAANDTEEAKYRALGWSEKRFAQMLYHKGLGAKVFNSQADVDKALSQGWSRTMFDIGPNETPMYHQQLGFKMAQSDKECEALQKKGWQLQPIVPVAGAYTAPASTGLPACYHPHSLDEHRTIHLEQKASEVQPA